MKRSSSSIYLSSIPVFPGTTTTTFGGNGRQRKSTSSAGSASEYGQKHQPQQQSHQRRRDAAIIGIISSQNPINVKPTKRQRLLKNKVRQQPMQGITPQAAKKQPPKIPPVSCNGNIEAIHAAKMAYFEGLQASLPDRDITQSRMQAKLETLTHSSGPERDILQNELDEWMEESERIRSRIEETDYLLKTMTLFNEYQAICKEETLLAEKEDDDNSIPSSSSSSCPFQVPSVRDKKRKIIDEYFAAIDLDPAKSVVTVASMGAASIAAQRKRRAMDVASTSASHSGSSSGSSSLEKLAFGGNVPAHTSSIKGNNGGSLPFRRRSWHKTYSLPPCQSCGCRTEMIITDESFLTCQNCGVSQPHFSGDVMSYKELQNYDFTRRFDYERPNHFSERLAQSQCKENIDIPEAVMELISLELKKDRVTDTSKINRVMMKAILKKTKLSKYYEHIPLIISKLNGKPPLRFEPELEEQLLVMFKEIQAPFEKHKPPGRRNCLSYPYILYKFCELLERDEFLPSFQLLKSREKLYKTDQIWKKICEELDWQFIPTV